MSSRERRRTDGCVTYLLNLFVTSRMRGFTTPADENGGVVAFESANSTVSQRITISNRKRESVIKSFKIALLAMLIGAGSATLAKADTIGPNCGTCQGGIYTLTNLGLAPLDLDTADGSFDTYRIALTIDTSGYTGGGTQIDEVAIKVSSSIDDAALVSAPGSASDWMLKSGGLNASGCSGSGSGFQCSDWILNSTTANQVGGVLTWVFDIDVASALLTGTDAAAIKVAYTDSQNNKVGSLVSENITLGQPTPTTPVPEPGTLSLLALGAGFVWVRRPRN